MPRIQNDSLNLANIWNTMRSHQWLDGLGHVSTRDEKFSIVFDRRKTQPTACAVDHRLAAATDKFQRILPSRILLSRRKPRCLRAIRKTSRYCRRSGSRYRLL